MHSRLRLIISVLVGVALAALIAFVQSPSMPKGSDGGIIGMQLGGNFAGLIDGQGRTMTDDTFKGKFQLVFFGFTSCPSICPTELQKIAVVLKKLDASEKARIAPIFVSVDPERDTPALIKDYTAMFDPAITGLTGTPDAVKRTKAEWKVYSAKVPTEDGRSYTVDHSAFLYFRGPDGRILGLFQTTDTPDIVYQTVKDALKKTP